MRFFIIDFGTAYVILALSLAKLYEGLSKFWALRYVFNQLIVKFPMIIKQVGQSTVQIKLKRTFLIDPILKKFNYIFYKVFGIPHFVLFF